MTEGNYLKKLNKLKDMIVRCFPLVLLISIVLLFLLDVYNIPSKDSWNLNIDFWGSILGTKRRKLVRRID